MPSAWVRKNDLGITSSSGPLLRMKAVGFSIGSKGYIGTGCRYDVALKDFWEYDPISNTWTQKSDFGGNARINAVGFSIGTKGYIGTGSLTVDNNSYTKDFWEYNPVNNIWFRKSDFLGIRRNSAVGFSIENKGYIGTGSASDGNFKNDFWEYNPNIDTWIQKSDFGGIPRKEAVGFSIGSKGYIGAGGDQISPTNDFWEYDPIINIWIKKSNFPGAPISAIGFGLNSKGYALTGMSSFENGVSGSGNLYEFNPTSNSWIGRDPLPSLQERFEAVGFTINSKGYLASGGWQEYQNDLWEFDPSSAVWILKTDSGGTSRTGGVGIQINQKGYLGLGDDRKDFWEFDHSNNSWIKKANFNTNRRAAASFSIGDKGYVGTGWAVSFSTKLKDFWEYNSTTNVWTQKANFGGVARVYAAGFSINSKGYIGTGNSSVPLKDFWEYDPVTNMWSQKANFGGEARTSAVGFSINSKGYIGTGANASNTCFKDFWEYNPITNSWLQKTNFGGEARYSAVGFSIGNYGYIGTGTGTGSNFMNDFWEYNSLTETWVRKSDFPGTSRFEAIGLSIINKGYVGTGYDGTGHYKSDIWEFDPSWMSPNISFYNSTNNQQDSFLLFSSNFIGESIPLKICADGSQSTFIEFENTDPSIFIEDVDFQIREDVGEIHKEIYGSFESPVTFSSNSSKVFYIHPTFMNANTLYKTATIQIIDRGHYNKIIATYPIQIYRAPVLMVHGWNGGLSTFSIMEGTLIQQKYISSITHRAEYPDGHFAENINAIPTGVDNLFAQAHAEKFSCGKVDIVAHSMGGVLSRLYLQSNNYRNDIHKLITLNTPHSGSQGANFLYDINYIPCQVHEWISKNKFQCSSALEDLRVNSSAIREQLNGVNTLNRHTVPSFVISTQDFLASDPDCYSAGLLLYSGKGGLLNFALVNSIFNFEDNDLVVPRSSQEGGISKIFNLGDQCHLKSARNPIIIEEVLGLLDAEPNSENFDIDGFNPPTLNTYLPSSVISNKRLTGNIEIISPLNGSTYFPGDQITIQSTGSNEIQKTVIAIGSDNIPIFSRDTLSSESITNYTIPFEANNELRIACIGYDTTFGFITLDTIRIKIQVNSNLDSLQVYPTVLRIPIGTQATLNVSGYYQDGIVRDISENDSISFVITDTIIAKNIIKNIIIGTSIGPTLLNINYKNQSLIVPIEVYQGENMTSTIISSDLSSICLNQSVEFSDVSIGNVISREWQFPGGTPSTSTLLNPIINYPLPGSFQVTLINSYPGKIDTVSLSNYITVNFCPLKFNLKLFIEGFYLNDGSMRRILFDTNNNIDSTVCDSITIELRKSISPFESVYSKTDIIHIDGTGLFVFPKVPSGSYYVVVNHRNSIETWSKFPLLIETDSLFYDFSK